MTLVKFEVPEVEADVMRMHYGQKVASKAYAMAAAEAIPLYRQTQELQHVIDAQLLEIRRLQGVIERARSSAAQLLEVTGQGDMLSV